MTSSTIYRLNRLDGNPRATFTEKARKEIIEEYKKIQSGDHPEGSKIYMSGVTKEVKVWIPGDDQLIDHWGHVHSLSIEAWLKYQ